MIERTLTARELNRALLARQFLLDRSSLPMVTTIERIGGLQTQYAPSGYVGLWSRMRNFRRDALTEALQQRRVVGHAPAEHNPHGLRARLLAFPCPHPLIEAGLVATRDPPSNQRTRHGCRCPCPSR